MQEHRFRMGQIVRLSSAGPGELLSQRYKVLRLLPAERQGPQYRIKPIGGAGNERVALESQLQGVT